MIKAIRSRLPLILLMIASFVVGGILLPRMQQPNAPAEQEIAPIAQADTPAPDTPEPADDDAEASPTPDESLNTPEPTPTPSNTLRPPPTLEPPTATPQPSLTPSITPTPELEIVVTVPGLQGLESPTPASTEGCVPREDWTLIYEVKFGDALAAIAAEYGTYASDLAAANCLDDPDLIVEGQKLRVPGEAHPERPLYDCTYQLLTPMDYAIDIDPNGSLTFSWIGPRAPRNLVRITRPDGSIVFERTVDRRQNMTISLPEDLPEGGEFLWEVYPLDLNFQQIDCLQSGPWHFAKDESAPITVPGG
jgi:LysM repeat protein